MQGEKKYKYHYKVGNCVIYRGEDNLDEAMERIRYQKYLGGFTILLNPETGSRRKADLFWDDKLPENIFESDLINH